MSTPANIVKPRAIHCNMQTAQSRPSLVGSEPTMHYSAHHESHSNTLCQPGIKMTLFSL